MEWYTSNCASQALSDKPFCVYNVLRHKTWKLQVICWHSAYQTTSLLLETFFVLFRFALQIQLESYGPRHTSVVLWYTTLCAYTASLRIHCYLICNSASQQNSRPLWATALLLTMHRFIITKLASYTTRCSVFYEFAANQPKKNIN